MLTAMEGVVTVQAATANVPVAKPENTLAVALVAGAYSWIVTAGIVVSLPIGAFPIFMKYAVYFKVKV
jgi:hypothetical protein